jgi:hypothetical protein
LALDFRGKKALGVLSVRGYQHIFWAIETHNPAKNDHKKGQFTGVIQEQDSNVSGYIGIDFDSELDTTTVVLRGTRFDYTWKFGSPTNFGLSVSRVKIAGADNLIHNLDCDNKRCAQEQDIDEVLMFERNSMVPIKHDLFPPLTIQGVHGSETVEDGGIYSEGDKGYITQVDIDQSLHEVRMSFFNTARDEEIWKVNKRGQFFRFAKSNTAQSDFNFATDPLKGGLPPYEFENP